MRARSSILAIAVLAAWLQAAGPGVDVMLDTIAGHDEHHCHCPLSEHRCSCPICAGKAIDREEHDRPAYEQGSCGDPRTASHLSPSRPILMTPDRSMPPPRLVEQALSMPPSRTLHDRLSSAPEPPPPRTNGLV